MRAFTLKTYHLHTKLSYQKSILRQIKWWVQNGPATKNGVLPVTNLFFWFFYFSLRTSGVELICCTNNLNAHVVLFLSAGVFFDLVTLLYPCGCSYPLSGQALLTGMICNFWCWVNDWIVEIVRIEFIE